MAAPWKLGKALRHQEQGRASNFACWAKLGLLGKLKGEDKVDKGVSEVLFHRDTQTAASGREPSVNGEEGPGSETDRPAQH